MKHSLKLPFLLLAMLVSTCPMLGSAAIYIQGSRVVYEEASGETSVHLRQLGETPGLVQIWLDKGDDAPNAHMQETPFLMTPTVARLEPGGGQTIRVLRIGDGLPQDRESLFFFNVLEVPPASKQIEQGDNYIQFSTRARLKFFYRPKGLTPGPAQAYQLLRFSLLEAGDEPGVAQVRIYNPSPYHITFKELALRNTAGDDAPVLAELVETVGVHQRTVPPMDELLLPLDILGEPLSLSQSSVKVDFTTVGDLGNFISGQRALD